MKPLRETTSSFRNLHLDATTLSATWSDVRKGQREIYYGRFDYTSD